MGRFEEKRDRRKKCGHILEKIYLRVEMKRD